VVDCSNFAAAAQADPLKNTKDPRQSAVRVILKFKAIKSLRALVSYLPMINAFLRDGFIKSFKSAARKFLLQHGTTTS
jgi:hypothetical protein